MYFFLNQEFPNTNIAALNVSFSVTSKLKGLQPTIYYIFLSMKQKSLDIIKPKSKGNKQFFMPSFPEILKEPNLRLWLVRTGH